MQPGFTRRSRCLISSCLCYERAYHYRCRSTDSPNGSQRSQGHIYLPTSCSPHWHSLSSVSIYSSFQSFSLSKTLDMPDSYPSSLLACALPNPMNTIPLLVVSRELTGLRKHCGLLCRAQERFIQTLLRLFLGRRPASLLVFAMQQRSPPACCVVCRTKELYPWISQRLYAH